MSVTLKNGASFTASIKTTPPADTVVVAPPVASEAVANATTSPASISAVAPAVEPVKRRDKGNHTRAALPSADVLGNPDALLRKAHVLALVGVSDNTLHKRIKDGLFPQPDLYLDTLPMWTVATVKDWLSGSIAKQLEERLSGIQTMLNATISDARRNTLLHEQRLVRDRLRSIRHSKRPAQLMT